VDLDHDGVAVHPDERCTADRCEHVDLRGVLPRREGKREGRTAATSTAATNFARGCDTYVGFPGVRSGSEPARPHERLPDIADRAD
jgi:hypothetical protein